MQCKSINIFWCVLLLGFFRVACAFADDAPVTYTCYTGTFLDPFEEENYDKFFINGYYACGLPELWREDLTVYSIYSGVSYSMEVKGPATGAYFTYVPTEESPFLMIYYANAAYIGYGQHVTAYDYMRVTTSTGVRLKGEFYFKSANEFPSDSLSGMVFTRLEEPGFVQGYHPWQYQFYDLRKYIGQPITIEVVASACSNILCETRMYLAFESIHLETLCERCEETTLKMVPNLESYSWHKGSPLNPSISNGDSYTVPAGEGDCYYCKIITADGPMTVLMGDVVHLYPEFDVFVGCDNVSIVNKSKQQLCSESIAHQPDTVVWTLDDGRTFSQYHLDDLQISEGEHTISLHIGSKDFACDTTLTKSFIVCPCRTNLTYDTICQNELPYIWNGHSITQEGEYIDTIPISIYCDSILALRLTILPIDSSHDNIELCRTQLPFQWHALTITEEGTFTQTLTNNKGCDSIVTMNVTIKEPSYATEYRTICKGQACAINGRIFMDSGDFYDTIPSMAGCDSVVHIIIMAEECSLNPDSLNPFKPLDPWVDCLEPTYNVIDTTIACEWLQTHPLGWFGKQYSIAGVYHDTIWGQNHFGCDSIGQLILRVTYKDTIVSCANQSNTITTPWKVYSIPAGQTDTTECLVTDAECGCLQSVSLHVHYIQSSSSTTYRQVKEEELPFVWNAMEVEAVPQNEARDTTLIFNTINASDCDSIATLHLHVLDPCELPATYLPVIWKKE